MNLFHRDTENTEKKESKSSPCAPYLRILIIAVVALLTVFAPSVVAQNPIDADVDFFAQPPEDGEPFTVGDHITLRLEVTHPAGSQVNLPQLDPEWGDFEVVNQSVSQTTQNGDGTAVTGKDIVVSLFEPGEYQTPPLLVTHQKPDGDVEELGAPVIPLRITSVLVEGDEELRDIKEQAEMYLPPVWPLVLGGLALSLVLAAILYFVGRWAYNRWWPKPQVAEVPEPVFVDTRPPEVIAYTELDRIESLNLPAQDQYKEQYSLVSDCLRQYIEDRYEIPALEQTTSEIQVAFGKSDVPSRFVRDFISLFITSDLVKFARFKPNVNDAYGIVAKARGIVDETTPDPALETPLQQDETTPEPEVML